MIDLDTFTKMPKNVGDLGKLIVTKGFQKLHKVQKSHNLVTLVPEHIISSSGEEQLDRPNSQTTMELCHACVA